MSFPSINLADLSVDESGNYAKKTRTLLIFQSQVTKISVVFKAYIKSMQHDFTSTWNSENVFGRMDPIATFQGTVRKVNFSFGILAGSLEEAKENFQHSNAVDYACLVAPEQCDSLPSRTKTNARGGQPRQVETQLRQ